MTKWQTRQALYLLGLTGILYLFSCKSQVIVRGQREKVNQCMTIGKIKRKVFGANFGKINGSNLGFL